MNRAEKKIQKLQAQCDAFNAANPVGTKVLVRRDSGINHITTTRSAAYVLSGHTAVIFLEGISGCYLLDRVDPILVQLREVDGKLVDVTTEGAGV